MKTFAINEKRLAPTGRKSSLNAHHPMRPTQLVQQAEIARILRSTGAQTKLTVGQPNNKYEQEADRVAEQVMRMSGSTRANPISGEPRIQRLCEECEDEVRRQPLEEEEELLQAKHSSGNGGSLIGADVTAQVSAVRQGTGTPLPNATRNFFEPRFGRDFSNVRIHADANAAVSAQSINARAYTLGSDIVFGSGQYEPHSQSGKQLLAHELTHVVQQNNQQIDNIQRWSFGSGAVPHSDYSEVPRDERARVTAAMNIIEKVKNRPKDWPRCHKFYQDNCTGGTADTFKQKVDKATIWHDKDNSVWGSGVDPDHVAYSAETWRWGRWTIAGVMIHEMMHRCGQDNETINDKAITACRFPDIDKEKPIVKK